MEFNPWAARDYNHVWWATKSKNNTKNESVDKAHKFIIPSSPSLAKPMIHSLRLMSFKNKMTWNFNDRLSLSYCALSTDNKKKIVADHSKDFMKEWLLEGGSGKKDFVVKWPHSWVPSGKNRFRKLKQVWVIYPLHESPRGDLTKIHYKVQPQYIRRLGQSQ